MHKVGDEPTGSDHPELLKVKALPGRGHLDTIINGIARIGFMSGGVNARWKDEEIADTLTGKAVQFIEQNQHKPFFLYFATHDIHEPRVPNPRWKGTSACGNRGDALQEFDGCVAAVLATLDRLKLSDHTLVIVTSDNGGVIEEAYHDGSEAALNGHRCNGPLRGIKGDLWEGGHREPFLARWPGHITPGSESTQLIGLVDMLATFAAVAGQNVLPGAGPDSINVLPAILCQNGAETVRRELVLQSVNQNLLALRQGNWEYIPPRGKGNASGGELYDLSADLGETNNLAAANLEKLKALQAKLEQIRHSVPVVRR